MLQRVDNASWSSRNVSPPLSSQTTDPRLSLYIDSLICIMMYGSNVHMNNEIGEIGERRLVVVEFVSLVPSPDDSTV